MNHSKVVYIQFLLCLALGGTAVAVEPTCVIRNRTVAAIDPRLFGSFMERPSWGETGPEGALVPGTDKLQPAVVDLLREMKIPIVRFPGGTDADYLDWRDMVSNAPGRDAARPLSTGHKGDQVSNNFGYDEFLQLSAELRWDTIITVNFRDGLLKKRPLDEAVRRAAALVAYCNAPVGAKLPPGTPDCPAIRALNGHATPYGVKFWQIGNETWFFDKELEIVAPKNTDRYYADCILAYARAMLAVDPSIEFIVDGIKGGRLAQAEMPNKIRHLVFHEYHPWKIHDIERAGKPVSIDDLTPAEVWYTWVATPHFDKNGFANLDNDLITFSHKKAVKIAVTEWNWNGWWDYPKAPLNSSFAKGVGSAGFLHALMRSGDCIDIACQSMLVGTRWPIHAIGVDAAAKIPPHFMPSGELLALYSAHHGPRLLQLENNALPTYNQPFKMGTIQPSPKVAYLDVLATADERTLFLHIINRQFEKELPLNVDAAEIGPLCGIARRYSLVGRLHDHARQDESVQISQITTNDIQFTGNKLTLTLPPRSVSCIEVPLKR